MSGESDFSVRRAELSAAKRTLLEKRLRGEFAGDSRAQMIPRRLKQGPAPLSFAQQRLWFLDQLEPGSPLYNIPLAIRLTGRPDVAALEQSLNEIVRRHQALRTTFATVDGQPVQVVAPVMTLTLPIVDLGKSPKMEQEVKARRLAAEKARQPFDLAQGPLLRVALVRLSETEHVLLMIIHHIVFDGWSMRVFFRELTVLYKAYITGTPWSLPKLPIQYPDFAVWQREWLQGEVWEAQLAYWRHQLGDLPMLQLPADFPRPSVQTFRGATRSFVLPKPLTEALGALSQREGVTLFMTLLATFKVLLYRYTGQEDILVGSPIANRNRSEIQGLIGFFVNTLVLRTDLSGNPTFQELLRRVRDATLGAYAHQDLPFEQLVQAVQPWRDLSHQPLFQVMFALQNDPISELELAGLTPSRLEVNSATAKFDLTLSMEETEQGLRGVLEYNTDLFDTDTVTRILTHFQILLAGIVAHPEQCLSELPILTEAERRQLLVEWNNTGTDYPKDRCLHQLFEAQVERTPDAIAVALDPHPQGAFGGNGGGPDQQLTYRELNQRANQLAHYLQTLGVGADMPVGICVERSLEMVVGLLGILKAGGAYVPLDPTHPQERLNFILDNSHVPLVLTQQRLSKSLPASDTRVVCLDSEWSALAYDSQENPDNSVTAENLAYVIYTSGSTGRPKGVLIPHKGIVNRLFWMQEVLQLTEADRVLQKTPFVFDVSVSEIFLPLLTGACLVIARSEGHLDSNYLVQLIAEQKITFVHFVPSMLGVFLEEQGIKACNNSLRYVWCGGEVLTVELQKRFFNRLDAKLYNGYGPTEASVGVTFWACQRESALVPIGRPIANTQVYLLDQHLNPVPIGIPGELHIGGVSLARGYLNHPELTAEKFMANPFSQEPGARLYKTGDLARYLPGGNIEFLGRIDHQVKVRGFRVELGEVEAVLGQHPAVREAVVMARKDLSGDDKQLVAYFVAAQEPAFTLSKLRSFLEEKLPDYMIPSTFVKLEAMPLTPNGKVDRRALPDPDTFQRNLEGDFVAPRTPIEETLADIWAEILGLEKVGVCDNFFELGGHSLLATRVISRLREAFRVDLPLRNLFEAPTVASLAERIEAIRWAAQGPQALSRARVGDREEIAL